MDWRKVYFRFCSSPYNCKIQLSLSEYINAIYRVNSYFEEIGTAPAYILSNSVEIGYREYLFGFSEILDYYKMVYDIN